VPPQSHKCLNFKGRSVGRIDRIGNFDRLTMKLVSDRITGFTEGASERRSCRLRDGDKGQGIRVDEHDAARLPRFPELGHRVVGLPAARTGLEVVVLSIGKTLPKGKEVLHTLLVGQLSGDEVALVVGPAAQYQELLSPLEAAHRVDW
jgi:hypothetical protein